jgi:hypothetical protein
MIVRVRDENALPAVRPHAGRLGERETERVLAHEAVVDIAHVPPVEVDAPHCTVVAVRDEQRAVRPADAEGVLEKSLREEAVHVPELEEAAPADRRHLALPVEA